MCYSKEVSLIAGTLIAGSGGYAWWRVHQPASPVAGLWRRVRQPALRPFYEQLILAFLAIGGHQFFEFLAVYTGNQVVYKIGLTTSILAVYFLIRALEKLSGYNFGSQITAGSIAVLFFTMLAVPMPFQNYHFWVRGYAHVVWGTVWLGWYIYFNLAVMLLAWQYKSKVNKNILLWSGLVFQNVSFYLAIAYALWAAGYTYGSWCAVQSLTWQNSFNFFQDFPSIWCTFAVMQAPFLIGAIYWFDTKFKRQDKLPRTISGTVRLAHISLTILIMALLAYFIPFIFGVSWKMVTF